MVTSGSALCFKLPLAAAASDNGWRSKLGYDDDWHVDSGTSNDARYTQATGVKSSRERVHAAVGTWDKHKHLAEMGRAAYMQYVLDYLQSREWHGDIRIPHAAHAHRPRY
jgi:hypothetical protein